MDITSVIFRGSYPKVGQCPDDTRPEYAFIGRSNVGKSSLVNTLTGRRDVARISKKPGKTQLINYFLVNHQWFLVDLPGYGYAKISKTRRKEWERMIQDYLVKRDTLQCTFLLIDANIPLQKLDLEFMNWMGEMHLPFVLVFTKADRSSAPVLEANLKQIRTGILEYWHELPTQFVTSSNDRRGRDEILTFIEEVNKRIQQES